jgi:hypothetical protein
MGNAGQEPVARGDVPVRRSVYESGTVSYDLSESGRRVRLSFRTDGTVRLRFKDEVVAVVRLHNTHTWCAVDLAPLPAERDHATGGGDAGDAARDGEGRASR